MASTTSLLLTRRALLAPAVLAPALLSGAAPSAPPPAPGSMPTRLILGLSDDPAHTQPVTWRTEIRADAPQAQFAPASADPAFEKSAATVQATSEQDVLPDGKSVTHYATTFTGLRPDTAYCYRVGDGKAWSEWNIFRTASDKPEPFRFLYVGDAQNAIRSLCSRTMRVAFATAPDARLLVHAGDLVSEGHDDRLWGEWSDAFSFTTAMTPSLAVVGNHDLHRAHGSPDSRKVFAVSPLWRHHFVAPANGPDIAEMPGQSYYVDYQGVRFVALDSNVFSNEDFEPAAKQRVWDAEVAWVAEVLANNPNRWTIVVQHQGIYAVTSGRNYAEMRAALTPLYEKHHVDVVLQGHDHCYWRSHKVTGDKVVDPAARGVVYVISVSGPKMYKLEPRHDVLMARQFERKQCFQVVDVSHEKLTLTSYTAERRIVDAFDLEKSGAVTRYVNRAPRIES